MNKVTLIGRLTADPTSGNEVARYTLAVNRRKQGEADFISCVVFGKSAEFVMNYLHKGMKIAVNGRLLTGSYVNKDGVKVYTTDVVVDEHEFCEAKKEFEHVEETPFD